MSAALESLKLAQDALVVFRACCVAGSAGEQLADEALAKVKAALAALAAHKPHQTCPNETRRLLGECCNPKRASARLTEEQLEAAVEAWFASSSAFVNFHECMRAAFEAANGLGGK